MKLLRKSRYFSDGIIRNLKKLGKSDLEIHLVIFMKTWYNKVVKGISLDSFLF